MVMVASVYIYIVAIVLRLLDNSSFLLIEHGISVDPFYLKPQVVKTYIDELSQKEKEEDKKLLWKLKRNLWYKRLHIFFTVLAIITLIAGIVYEIYNPYLVELI